MNYPRVAKVIYDNLIVGSDRKKQKHLNIDDMRKHPIKALSHSIWQGTLWAKIWWPVTAMVGGHMFHICHGTPHVFFSDEGSNCLKLVQMSDICINLAAVHFCL